MSQAPVETDDGHPHPFQRIGDEGVNRLLVGGPREHFAQICAFLGRGYRLGGGVPATEGKAARDAPSPARAEVLRKRRRDGSGVFMFLSGWASLLRLTASLLAVRTGRDPS